MKFQLDIALFLAVAFSIGFLCKPLNAEIIVEITDVELVAGGTGVIDVMVESDIAENLDLFQYEFRISGLGTNVGSLQFTSPQLSTEVSDPDYVHSGDSGGFISVAQNGPQFDEVLGGDFTSSFLGTQLTSKKLFAQLDIEHLLPASTPASAAANDQFSISLVDDGDTFFSDSNFNTLAFSNTGDGQVTIIAAVPEPSVVLFLLSAITALSIRRHR